MTHSATLKFHSFHLSFFRILDKSLTPIPVILIHVVYPLAYKLLWYILRQEELIQVEIVEYVVYPGFLDWADPGMTTMLIFLYAIGITLSQLFLWGILKIKMVVFRYTVSSPVQWVNEWLMWLRIISIILQKNRRNNGRHLSKTMILKNTSNTRLDLRQFKFLISCL